MTGGRRSGPSCWRESIQWNWKVLTLSDTAHHLPASESIQWNWKDTPMAGYGGPRLNIAVNPYNGIESAVFPGVKLATHVIGIHTMELKESGLLCCRSCSSIFQESIQWNWKYSLTAKTSSRPVSAESIQWNWKSLTRPALSSLTHRIHTMELKEPGRDWDWNWGSWIHTMELKVENRIRIEHEDGGENPYNGIERLATTLITLVLGSSPRIHTMELKGKEDDDLHRRMHARIHTMELKDP